MNDLPSDFFSDADFKPHNNKGAFRQPPEPDAPARALAGASGSKVCQGCAGAASGWAGVEPPASGGTAKPPTLASTRSKRQFLVFDSGRVSMISTVSPIRDSFCSSWTWQMVRRRMYLP